MKIVLKQIQKLTACVIVLTILFGLGAYVGKVYKPLAEAAPLAATTLLGGRSLDGTVYDIEVSDDIAYLGGNFSSVAFESAYGAVINDTTGEFVSGELGLDESVLALALDGSGGYYIGGYFTSVIGETRNYLAHIESDGTLDTAWNPDPDDVVRKITVSGSDIFVAGDFTTIGGETRAGLAKLNNTDGEADPDWNPAPDGQVDIIAVSGSYIYVGGFFANIGGLARGYAAKLDNSNGSAVVAWNPSPDDFVTDMAISGSDIYIVGGFNNIGGQARNYAAKLDDTNGNANIAWNPNPDIRPVFVEISGSDIFVAGHFSNIGGQDRQKIAKLNNTNGNADLTWDAPAAAGYDGGIYSLAVSDSAVYFGADFTSIGGQEMTGIAKLSITTGDVDLAWNARADSYEVNAIATSGSNVYVGGGFSSVGGQSRLSLAAIDLTTNELTDWNPGVSGEVYSMSISGSDLYLGGEFSAVGGEVRANLAKVDLDSGEVDATWDPDANDYIQALAISGSDIYVSGRFTTIGGLARDNVAKLNNTNGDAVAAFDMSTYFNGFGSYPSLDVLDSYLYLASSSPVTIDLVQYRSVFKVNKTTGEIDATWPGGCSACGGGDVYFSQVISPYVYVSGNFASYQAGAPSGKLIRLNLDGTIDETWSPTADDRALAVGVSGSDVFVGGAFDEIGGQTRDKLAKLNGTTGSADLVWNTAPGGTVEEIEIYGSSVLVGGQFSGGIKRYDFPTVGFSSATASGLESAGSQSVAINMSSASDLETTVSYTVTSGTAIAGTDVTQTSGTITFVAGDTVEYLQLNLVDDTVPESNETFTVTLTVTGGALLGDLDELTFTISGESETTSRGSVGRGSPVNNPVPSPTTPDIVFPISSPVLNLQPFTRDLQYGSNGADVTLLQKFLNFRGFTVSPSGYGSPGNETIYFRSRTMRALQSFQRVYIDTLKEANGRLDGATRDLINFMASF